MKKILSVLIIVLSIVALIALIVFLLKGSPKSEVLVSHDMVIHQIEELGNLEVVRYNIQDIIEYNKIRRWLPNSRTSLQISAEVIACVDLTRIRPEDIFTEKDSVRLTLPVPEICHYKIDHSRSRVYNVDFGFWETANLVDEAYREAERHIYQEAVNMGIARESRDNAVKVLTPILRGLGFSKVDIRFQSPYQNTERPQIRLDR